MVGALARGGQKFDRKVTSGIIQIYCVLRNRQREMVKMASVGTFTFTDGCEKK